MSAKLSLLPSLSRDVLQGTCVTCLCAHCSLLSLFWPVSRTVTLHGAVMSDAKRLLCAPVCLLRRPCTASVLPELIYCTVTNVVALCRNGLLYTLNGQCREEQWQQLKNDMEVAAESFHMLGSRTDIPGWGSRL